LEEQTLVFNVASGKFCSALEETVLTMKKSEVCEVRCTSPSVCTDAELNLPGASSVVVLSLELKEFGKVNLYDLPDAGKVAHCALRKDVGAKFFKEGNWLRALKRYKHVAQKLQYIDHWADADAKAEAAKLRRVSNTNAAACHLKMEAWREASNACDAVLKEEPDNVKALFRRGHACSELSEYREAHRDLRRVLELDRENKEAHRLLAKVKQFMKSEVANEKKMFSKMCGNSPKSTDKAGVAKSESKGGIPEEGEEALGDDSCFYIAGATVLLAAVATTFLWSSGRLRGKGF